MMSMLWIQPAAESRALALNSELLLPVIPDCIKNVDIENGVITVFLMPGLV